MTKENNTWFAAQQDNTTTLWEVYESETDNCIAEGISKENAILIAAASDLLSALEEALEHLEYCNYGDKWERERAEALGLSLTINAAIKRARGE